MFPPQTTIRHGSIQLRTVDTFGTFHSPSLPPTGKFPHFYCILSTGPVEDIVSYMTLFITPPNRKAQRSFWKGKCGKG